MDNSGNATKADINRLEQSTKADINRLEQSTKADINRLDSNIQNLEKSTKIEFKRLEKSTKADNKYLRQEIIKVEERVENLEEGQTRIEIKLDRIMNTLDGFVGRVDDLSVDNEVGAHQTRELQIKFDDHEKRLKQIESSKASA